MPLIEIYTKPTCPYCIKAKALLNAKGAKFTEINIIEYPEQCEIMINRANGRTTVPQIFIANAHIGGCDDLHALDAEQKLDVMLKTA